MDRRRRPSKLGGTSTKKPKTEAAASTEPVVDDEAEAMTLAINTEHMQQFQKDLDTLNLCPTLESLADEKPLSILQAASDGLRGGHQAPFNQIDFQNAMSTERMYVGSCNMMWVDLWWRPNKGVPINMKAMEQMVEHQYAKAPSALDFTAVVAAEPAWKIDEFKGKLKLLSPEELPRAAIAGCALAVRNGSPLEDLFSWRKAFLTVSFKFLHIDSLAKMMWKSINLREESRSTLRACVRTSFGRIVEVWEIARKLRLKVAKVTNAVIAVEYRDNVKMSVDSEAITDNMVQNIMSLWKKALNIDRVKAAVERSERRRGVDSPFDSILKMYLISGKGETDDVKIFIWEAIDDNDHANTLQKDELAVSKLRQPINYVDVLAFKPELKDIFMTVVVLTLSEKPNLDIIQIMRKVLHDHVSYRKHHGFPGEEKVCNAWQAM